MDFMFHSRLAEVLVAAPVAVERLAGRDPMSGPPAARAVTRRRCLAALLGGAAIGVRRARAQAEVPAFEVTSRDIARIHDLGGRLHIALNGAARARFAAFTAGNLGRLARVTAGGVVLVEAVVRAEIGSGLFSSAALDDHTRGRVFRLLIGG